MRIVLTRAWGDFAAGQEVDIDEYTALRLLKRRLAKPVHQQREKAVADEPERAVLR